MTQNWFKNCKTQEEVKNEYRRLCFIHHPDRGGDTSTMQDINAQYAQASNARTRQENPRWTEYQYQEAARVAEVIRVAIEKIITLDRIEIEVCGLWVWVSGDTRPVKDILKSAGFRWARRKKMWYFAGVPARNKGRTLSMSKIRSIHGSQKVRLDENDEVVYA